MKVFCDENKRNMSMYCIKYTIVSYILLTFIHVFTSNFQSLKHLFSKRRRQIHMF